MGLFNRKKASEPQGSTSSDQDSSSDPQKKEKGGWRRPANTAFKQQRLKAWQPILTPKTVLPTLFIIGILFAPIGGLLIWGSSSVSEMTFDYTDCEKLTPQNPKPTPSFSPIPNFTYRLRSSDAGAMPSTPQYAFIQDPFNPDLSQRDQCILQFEVPADLEPPVLLYYKLTNFFQNHRRYVKSFNSDQLKGKPVSNDTLHNGDCKPLALSNGKPIYPCGLVANSLFNDTFIDIRLLNPADDSNNFTAYNFSETGIAWPGEAKKYKPTTYNASDIVPPPNWSARFPQGYNSSNLPDLSTNEHFQNWMRTSGLPTFSKLWGRNDHDVMAKGNYQVTVNLNFPVLPYKGTKSIVISTVSWIGGKNPFLGWAYVTSAAVFVLLAVAGTARHVIKPRRLGDMSLLSWNR
jgi:hypothetical protein